MERGADIHHIDNEGNNVLMRAADRGSDLSVKYLLQETNIDINTQNKVSCFPLLPSIL